MLAARAVHDGAGGGLGGLAGTGWPALLTVALTAWYATRLGCGRSSARRARRGRHPHEPPAVDALAAAAAGRAGRAARLRRRWPAGSSAGWARHRGRRPLRRRSSRLVPRRSLLLAARGAGRRLAGVARDAGADPARALGPAAAGVRRRLLPGRRAGRAGGPAGAGAGPARCARPTRPVVDGAVEGTGGGAVGLGAAAGRAHRAGAAAGRPPRCWPARCCSAWPPPRSLECGAMSSRCSGRDRWRCPRWARSLLAALPAGADRAGPDRPARSSPALTLVARGAAAARTGRRRRRRRLDPWHELDAAVGAGLRPAVPPRRRRHVATRWWCSPRC